GQYGVVGRGQLLEAGWTEEEIDGRIRVGRLHRLHPAGRKRSRLEERFAPSSAGPAATAADLRSLLGI
ncbi:MAG: hypothetical protein M3335_07225, partial [Actinomycetota bacterium]|nr:hypothetical protein [Actinomycetota bacterium]